jgi:beta-galactosidase
MFPTKSFDAEDHRVEHMRRHAMVLDGYYSQEDVAGGFGWCMADYNTHKDFGSGDRICYHGVLDMFRNPKLASYVYSSQNDDKDILEVSSMMDIGEHPGCLAKDVYAITNADSVKLYKNDKFIKEFAKENSPFNHLPHGPILIDDFIGEIMEKEEGFSHGKAEDVKKILLACNKFGIAHLPFKIKMLAAKCILFRGLNISDAFTLYNKYIGNWGGTYTTYKFEAIKAGQVVKSQIRKAVTKVYLDVKVSHTELKEENTYDVSSIQIKAVDDNNVVLSFYQDPVFLEAEGPIEIIGPNYVSLRGGMGGTYIKTTGKKGIAKLRISGNNLEEVVIEFNII